VCFFNGLFMPTRPRRLQVSHRWVILTVRGKVTGRMNEQDQREQYSLIFETIVH
jgi:hypothetical protein